MSTQNKNAFWSLFSSVKLALFLLFTLATTSIIGTIVPQNNPPEFYIRLYGVHLAKFMQTLGVPDMYNSWWFIGLLILFSLNLIVCSLERIPNAWRLVTQDNLKTNPAKLEKMGQREIIPLPGASMGEAVAKTASYFASRRWKAEKRDKDGGTLFFAQKGAWSRFGVYLVHSSILIILVGAIIGSPTFARKFFHAPNFAFKGSVMLPEGKATNFVYSSQNGREIPLGFTVRCDHFDIEYYSNGMPKDYRAKLTVIDHGKVVLQRDIEVNNPLRYKGITFYQASYQPYPSFIVQLTNKKTGVAKKDVIPAREQIVWKKGGASFGIINMQTRGQIVERIKVWFTDNQGAPSEFWIEPNREAVIKRPSGDFLFKAKQLYATGLQVSKDPGVWLVYLGCALMLSGLLVAFFMSHRKIWAFVSEKEGQVSILFAGSANKNKLGFEKTFKAFINQIKGLAG
ncbi:MAG: cytochrome c biogenesis protein ResB [Proteobacteria bacterium]|nr:cytochrome c biogenesis protein ResB [Pseudomonadota bacterium]